MAVGAVSDKCVYTDVTDSRQAYVKRSNPTFAFDYSP